MRRLVIAPHVDDDVLGCGGILDAETVTFYCGVDEHHVVSANERLNEAIALSRRTGGRFWWPGVDPFATDQVYHDIGAVLLHSTSRVVNEYTIPSLVADFECVINAEQPDEVFIPWPSYNQDHRAVYEAALVALRPHDANHFVRRVLAYEGSQVNYWDWALPGLVFHPTYFVPIEIEEKLARYACMPSQVRDFRSPDALRALALLRGGEANVPAAEAFVILRWVEDAR